MMKSNLQVLNIAMLSVLSFSVLAHGDSEGDRYLHCRVTKGMTFHSRPGEAIHPQPAPEYKCKALEWSHPRSSRGRLPRTPTPMPQYGAVETVQVPGTDATLGASVTKTPGPEGYRWSLSARRSGAAGKGVTAAAKTNLSKHGFDYEYVSISQELQLPIPVRGLRLGATLESASIDCRVSVDPCQVR